jgi:hypothetical protein
MRLKAQIGWYPPFSYFKLRGTVKVSFSENAGTEEIGNFNHSLTAHLPMYSNKRFFEPSRECAPPNIP